MIYDHFGSKEGLYRAVLDEQSRDMGAAWRPVLDRLTGQDPVEATRVALRAFFDLVCERPLLVPLLLHEGLGEGEIRPPIEPADLPAPLREVFERGQREGVFRADGDFELFYVNAIFLLTVLPALPRRLTALAGAGTGQARARHYGRDGAFTDQRPAPYWQTSPAEPHPQLLLPQWRTEAILRSLLGRLGLTRPRRPPAATPRGPPCGSSTSSAARTSPLWDSA